MAKDKTVFFCNDCGYESSKWLGKCPTCNSWNSFVEEKVKVVKTGDKNTKRISNSEVKRLIDVEYKDENRLDTGYEELNRVLGSGLVGGSLLLIGGEPGIGKSTLVLQVCDNIAKKGKVLYVSGEESDMQVKLRADRLKVSNENLLFFGETNIEEIENQITKNCPILCVIDSIQTMYSDDISSGAGSVSQVREVTSRLMSIAKQSNVIVIVIGHVTKDGTIAGPRVLEHMVDVVLYIEGERFLSHRIVRGVKNRFGSTNEIGIFEMVEKGMIEVKNMSELFLSGADVAVPGTVTTAVLEGNSILVLEIQALTAHSYYNMPRRVANGIDLNRLNMIIAVIEKVCGIALGSQDIYINVVGGLKITETSVDLAVALAIISSYKSVAVEPGTVFVGEISLTGEIRNVLNIEKRIKELEKIGYKKMYGPKKQLSGLKDKYNIKMIALDNIQKVTEKFVTKED